MRNPMKSPLCPSILGTLLVLPVVAWIFALPGARAAEWHVNPASPPGGDGSPGRPFATMDELAAALPKAPDEPLAVHLAKGTHRLSAPLVITPKETRGQSLVFRGSPEGSVISGGKRLSGWRAEGGRWVHPWDGGTIRELFVNGRRAPRSRFPAEGWLKVDKAVPDKRSGFTSQADLPASSSGMEVLFLHDWSISRVPVASIAGRLLKTGGPIGFPAAHYVIDHFEAHPRFCLENGIGFLKAPGTWCHDPAGKRLVYLPRPGEKPENVEFIVPSVTALLRVSGAPGHPVADVRFENLSFQHCRWTYPKSGYAEGQATKHVPRDQPAPAGDAHQAWKFVPWAVEVSRAERVVFRDCRFEHLGGSGVCLGALTRDCALERCTVRDVSGNGIGVGEGHGRKLSNGKPWWRAAPGQAAAGNRVSDCLVEHCGARFHGAVGIWVGLAKDTRVARNEVRLLPYTGISVGWIWSPAPSPCGGNIIERNHIHHVMQLLSDGGGIYTLGRQPGTALRANHIHHIPLNAGRAESNGMFLDEGSSEFVIEGNLIHDTARSPLRFHKAGKIEVRGNSWVLPPNIPPMRFNRTDPADIHARDNTVLDANSLKAALSYLRRRMRPRKRSVPRRAVAAGSGTNITSFNVVPMRNSSAM
jgi:hypothetical protein